MQVKDLTDERLLDAIRRARAERDRGNYVWPADMLPDVPEKVVYRKMEQLVGRKIVEYGVSLRSGWIIAENR